MPTTPQTGPRPVLDTPFLPLARYRLDFHARDHITLSPFQGAV
jgi:hypothetical protein